MEFVTDCVSCDDGDSINEMKDDAREITYRTFMKNIGGWKKIADIGPFSYYDWPGQPKESGLTMKRDWHLGYYKGEFQGHPCYYVTHSGIEFIFV